MSKKTIRILSTIFTVLMILMVSTTVSFAAEATEFTPSQVNPDTTGGAISNVQTVGNSVLGIIRVVGTIVAVGILMVLGIKYMMGSAEEKAAYKKTMMPYIVGAVLIFAASNLAQYVYDFAAGL